MSEIELLNFRLNQFFNMFIVDDYGNLFAQRELVGKIQNLKLYIYPKDHNPPHFHVRSPDFDASFNILTCEIINGNIDLKSYKKIKIWHESSIELLINTWENLK